MDHDFYIELEAKEGLTPLKPFMSDMPFEVFLNADSMTLVQGAISEFASFHVAAPPSSDRHFYEASVRRSHVGEPVDVLRKISSVLQRADMPHWVWRVEHDLDEDELVVDAGRDLSPVSHGSTERWAERTEENGGSSQGR